MSGTSISSQLQAFKTAVNVSADPEPGKRRPLTRPSIIFEGIDAADTDLDTILNMALSGLEVLINTEERFRNYRNDLFSYQTKELDRELVGQEENKRINASISSYLRLLSGHLESRSAWKTLEYLIRRYKVHVYNAEDLLLCAIPYHETHVFVRVVRLVDTRNTRWKFLEGVKESGARLPREVIVQQCIRDMGVLEAICNYATPVKKIQPSKHVIGFCTAVIFEVLGLVTVDSDTIKRILPYVNSGLQLGAKGPNQKAAALMIVSLLAQKAALAPNVVKSLLHLVADMAKADAKGGDLRWLHMSFMTIITIVQLQSVKSIPKKTVEVLNEIRDISGILSGLMRDFNIDKFLTVFLESLLEYSASDDKSHCTLLSIIKTVPVNAQVNHIVSRLLAAQLLISQGASELGSHDKQILNYICEKYPNESREAFYCFLKGPKIQSKKVKSNYDLLCKIFDENLDMSQEILNPKFLFALEHPEADIRRSAVLGLDVTNILGEKAAGSKKFYAIQDGLLRRLYDDDVNVVLAVLNLKNLAEIITSPLLIEALQYMLQRCIQILLSSSSTSMSLSNAALLCLQQAITNFRDQEQFVTTLATMIFPLLLVQPKTQRLNLKALELAKELNWPFYDNIVFPGTEKKLDAGRISSINIENITKLADTFSLNPEEYMLWLVKCYNFNELSKALVYLILLQSLKMQKMGLGQFLAFLDFYFPILKSEWERLESLGISAERPKRRALDGDCKGILEDLLKTDFEDLSAEILPCLFLSLSEAFIATSPDDTSLDMNGKWASSLEDLFTFFSCYSGGAFKKHLECLLTKFKISLIRIMLKLFTEEGVPYATQIESLHSFSHICSQLDDSVACQLLAAFPSLLIPLSSDNKNVRVAAMSCMEGLSASWDHINRKGNNGVPLNFHVELLHLIIKQKKMILLDKNIFSSFFTSLLSSSHESLLMHQSVGKRFDESTKDDILVFVIEHALGLPAYAKLKILTLVKGAGSKLMSISGVRSLLNDLLERHHQYYIGDGKLCYKLSQSEVDILCLLLESCTRPYSSDEVHDLGDVMLKVLRVNDSDDYAALEPCMMILRNFSSSLYGNMKTETQDLIFRNLLVLLRSANGGIQNSARDTLLRINLNCSIVGRVLDFVLDQKTYSVGPRHVKKQKKPASHQDPDQLYDAAQNRETMLSLLSALLDVLLMKKDIENRTSLVGPLFKLLRLMFTNDEWMSNATDQVKLLVSSSESGQTDSDSTAYLQQSLLSTLEDICVSIRNDIPQKDIIQNFDLRLLVSCARSSSNAITRNRIFSLITTLVKIIPDQVLDQIFDIIAAVGESTVVQWDSYSQRVFEGLISAVVPCWLSRSNNTDQLLQIFIDVLPRVVEHRRHSVVAHILRTLGEAESLGSLLFLLFRSIISRKNELNLLVNQHSFDHLTSVIYKQWEYAFATMLCQQYSCTIWLPSLVLALQKIGNNGLSEETFMQMRVAMYFVSDKLRDPEISYKLELEEDFNHIQTMIGDLMEQVVYHLQFVDSKKMNNGVSALVKSELKEYIRGVLKSLTEGLLPSSYFNVLIKLMSHVDRNIKKKALGLLCETVKAWSTNTRLDKKASMSNIRSSWLHLNEISLESFENLCKEILTLLDAPDDMLSLSLKLAAVSALEALANRFHSQDRIFSLCLGSVCRGICSDNSVLSGHCLRATGALINALGPKGLPELPSVMEYVLRKSRDVSSVTADKSASGPSSLNSLFMSLLLTLEAVVNNLAGFLSPYVGDILRIVVLHPFSFSSSDLKLKVKADDVRKLITEKIPVRHLLPHVMSLHSDAIVSGESSLSVIYKMLGDLVGSMDRSSIGAHHAKVFDLCLLALDLRHQNPPSLQNIDLVEQCVINAVVTLTMKLTETMFRPLFIKTIEWSGLNDESVDTMPGKANCRAISFYSLVNTLAESHRSLFVPYFKYFLDGCVRGLSDSKDTKTSLFRKKKKAKLNSKTFDKDGALAPDVWHLRALILSSLHKCFLYDAGSSKFLDSSNFQVLLKPVVSQLVVEPPVSIEDHPNLPSVEEVDNLLVDCVGQMAVSAGSDLLWKPLNHEVLMQTRSEKTRARILGLRIVRYLVEKLKEEYLVLLPETIPSLGEVLEDVEEAVKSLAQEILKEMETMSGESLREYL